jgi:hypothetical protein
MSLPLLAAFGSAHALTITYDDFVHVGTDDVDYIMTVDDDTPGKFTITIGVANGSANTTAKLTGIGFDVGDDGGYTSSTLGLNTNSTVSLLNPSGSVNPSAIGFDKTKINGHTNMGQANTSAFDVIVAFKGNNPATLVDLSTPGRTVSFQIDRESYTLADWGRVGIRGQDVGDGGDGSALEVQNAPSVVPIPAAVWLFGSALAGIVGIGYRKGRKG